MSAVEAVVLEQLPNTPDVDKAYPLPGGVSVADFAALTEKQKDIMLWNIASQEIMKFNELHPEFYRDPEGKNARAINDFLIKNNWPITRRNLEVAYKELMNPASPAEARLVERPAPIVVPVPTLSLWARVARYLKGRRPKRVETKEFVGEIKWEDGQWVARLEYKNDTDTEQFVAASKKELMLKLLEGKGYATLRTNKAIRREKLGWSNIDKQYPLPEGFTAQDFADAPEKQQDIMLWNIASQEIMKFNELHPEFYRDPEGKNAKALNDFLIKNNWPITVRNLEVAYEELTDETLPRSVRLKERPTANLPAAAGVRPVIGTVPGNVARLAVYEARARNAGRSLVAKVLGSPVKASGPARQGNPT